MPPRTKENMPMALPPGRPPDKQPRAPRNSMRPSSRPIACRHTSKVPRKNDRVWAEEKPRKRLLEGKTAVTKTTKMGNQRAPPGSIPTTRRNGTIENKTYRSRMSQRYPLRPLQSGCDSSYRSTTWEKEIREHANGMRSINRSTGKSESDFDPRSSGRKNKQEGKKTNKLGKPNSK